MTPRQLPPESGGGWSLGSDDGNGDGRGASGVTAGLGGDIGRGAAGAVPRGGNLDFATRREPDFGFAALVRGLARDFALRADVFAAPRFAITFFRRAGAAFFRPRVTFFVDFRFFAMIVLPIVSAIQKLFRVRR